MSMLLQSALNHLSQLPQECRNSTTANPAYSLGLPKLHGVMATLWPAHILAALKLIWICLCRQLLHLCLKSGLVFPDVITLEHYPDWNPSTGGFSSTQLAVSVWGSFIYSKIPLYTVLINYVTYAKRNSGHWRFFYTTHGIIITETYIEKSLKPDSLGFFTLDGPQMSFTD